MVTRLFDGSWWTVTCRKTRFCTIEWEEGVWKGWLQLMIIGIQYGKNWLKKKSQLVLVSSNQMAWGSS